MEGGYCERLAVTSPVTCGTGGQAAATKTANEEGNGEVLHCGLISPGSRCSNSQTLRFGKRPHFVSGAALSLCPGLRWITRWWRKVLQTSPRAESASQCSFQETATDSRSHFDPEAEDLSEEYRNLRTRQTASRMTVEVLDEDQGHPESDG